MEKPETTVGMIDVLQGVYKGNTEGEKYVADILAEGLPHLHNLQSELSRSGYAGSS